MHAGQCAEEGGHVYRLVTLANGESSVRSETEGETFHPVAGPIAEAETLYVDQLRLRERLRSSGRELVVWDVGLGAGGNACTALRRLADIPGRVRLLSFDSTLAALRFARDHADALKFPIGFEEAMDALLEQGAVEFEHGALSIRWETVVGDFPAVLAGTAQQGRSLPAPDAIFFDAFSPARNPDMWRLPLFQNLFRALDPAIPCDLATFSRSTMARVTMLVAGFFVGAGASVSGKEETTIASNDLSRIERPLDAPWLERARISTSAEPLAEPIYRQARLRTGTWDQLRSHPQFRAAR